MEGSSAPGGASMPPLDPKVIHASGENPMAQVPTGDAPGSEGTGTPSGAATSIPQPQAVPQNPPPMNRPVVGPPQPHGPIESIFLQELQETKAELKKIRVNGNVQQMFIGIITVAAILYLINRVNARIPKVSA
jgi:hypothetical protein